jgi:hypothetical protein
LQPFQHKKSGGFWRKTSRYWKKSRKRGGQIPAWQRGLEGLRQNLIHFNKFSVVMGGDLRYNEQQQLRGCAGQPLDLNLKVRRGTRI